MTIIINYIKKTSHWKKNSILLVTSYERFVKSLTRGHLNLTGLYDHKPFSVTYSCDNERKRVKKEAYALPYISHKNTVDKHYCTMST